MSNFQPREVVDRGSEAQLQVGKHFNKLTQQDNSYYNVGLHLIKNKLQQ